MTANRFEINDQGDSSVNEGGRENLSQEALKLYQCGPGGPIVTKPEDCRPMNQKGILPKLELTS